MEKLARREARGSKLPAAAELNVAVAHRLVEAFFEGRFIFEERPLSEIEPRSGLGLSRWFLPLRMGANKILSFFSTATVTTGRERSCWFFRDPDVPSLLRDANAVFSYVGVSQGHQCGQLATICLSSSLTSCCAKAPRWR